LPARGLRQQPFGFAANRALLRQPQPIGDIQSLNAMKLFVVKKEIDQFEKAQQLLQRDLTPQERKWLILANALLSRFPMPRLVKRVKFKAA